MRMTLARKGLLAHVQVVKAEDEITETWLINDAKALGIIAQGVELQYQTKILSATRAMHAWGILRDFYNRSTLHNRVTMTRRLHDFKMENGSSLSKHLDAFDELVVVLQTLGEPVDEQRADFNYCEELKRCLTNGGEGEAVEGVGKAGEVGHQH